MIAGSDGNISVRLDKDRILITRSGVAKGRMTERDIVVVAPNGGHVAGDGKPSSEMPMHLYVYNERPDIMACVHAHPPHATAFAVAGLPLEDDVLPEVVVFVGRIPLTEYAPPGTDAVPKALAPHVKTNNAFLLRNHGLLTVGRTLEEAYNRHETVEQLAKILTLARQLGQVHRIPQDDFERLSAMRRSFEQ